MMRRFIQSAVRASRAVALAGICVCVALASVPLTAQGKKESKEAAKFRTQAEQARVAIETARDQLAKTVAVYDECLAAKEKKLAGAHKKLSQEVSKTEKVVEDGRKRVEAFQQTAEGFFVNWEKGVAEISTESIRAASEQRFEAARTGFQNMSESLKVAREAYDPLISSLKEQVALLGQDLTLDTTAMLSKEVAPDLHQQAEKVFASIDQSLSKEKAKEDEVNQILAEEAAESSE